MPKRCPPGIICIENFTLLISILLIFALSYILFLYTKSSGTTTPPLVIKNINPPIDSRAGPPMLSNPYNPPFKPTHHMPINQNTQGFETSFSQMGLLTRQNGTETILPLMGKQLLSNRDKWQYYTMSDKNNSIRLPITFNGKSCTAEYGCDSLYNGDTVYVEGYNDAFQITMYENNSIKYIPVL